MRFPVCPQCRVPPAFHHGCLHVTLISGALASPRVQRHPGLGFEICEPGRRHFMGVFLGRVLQGLCRIPSPRPRRLPGRASLEEGPLWRKSLQAKQSVLEPRALPSPPRHPSHQGKIAKAKGHPFPVRAWRGARSRTDRGPHTPALTKSVSPR